MLSREASNAEQIKKYAEFISLDLQRFPQLSWIAAQGLQCPIPDGWTVVRNPDGSHYFFHAASNTKRIDHPSDDVYRQLAQRSMSEELARQRQGERQLGSPQHRDAKALALRKPNKFKTIRYFLFLLFFVAGLHYVISLSLVPFLATSVFVAGGGAPVDGDNTV